MDPDPGGPKICGSCGSESPTLLSAFRYAKQNEIKLGKKMSIKYKQTIVKEFTKVIKKTKLATF
jgi:hypothetical protein